MITETLTSNPVAGADLTAHRIYTPQTLGGLIARQGAQQWVVEDVFGRESFNVLVGDSGLGKTPLAVQLAACVATGTQWLGLQVSHTGPALYLNGEMPAAELLSQWNAVCTHIGHPGLREGFYVHSPEWGHQAEGRIWTLSDLQRTVELVQPALIIVDPLRVFFPQAETDTLAFDQLRKWARATNSCVVCLHHRRKHDQVNGTVSLQDDPREWLQETSGLSHIINLTDARLGVESPRDKAMGDLVVAGFLRARGLMDPLYVARAFDDDGAPVGYTVQRGLDYVSAKAHDLYGAMGMTFRFTDAKRAMGGTSDSATKKALDELLRAGMLVKVPDKGGYRKKAVS